MKTITAANRTAYLGGDVTPTINAFLRQLRLEFQDASGDPYPMVMNSSGVFDVGVGASDDKEGYLPWGDSCTHEGYALRLFTKSVWSDTADWFASITADGQNPWDWEYADITNCSTTPAAQCRIGVYHDALDGTSLSFWVWYASGTDIYREKLTYDTAAGTWTWSDQSVAKSVATPGFDSIAIHPIDSQNAYIVAFKDHYVWMQYIACDKAGTEWDDSGAYNLIWSGTNLGWRDALFSDAAKRDTGEYLIVANLADHGAPYSVTHIVDTDLFSQPRSVLGGGVDDTGYRLFPTGLTLDSANGRMWLVTWRSLEGSDDTPYAHHVALASTTDGRLWKDEDFVGVHLCFGKLLFHDSGTAYSWVAGNTAVYRCATSYKLGYDNTDLKQTLYAGTWKLQVPRAGGASSLTAGRVLNDSDAMSDSSLLRADNQVVFQLGIDGGASDDYFTGYLARPGRDLTARTDQYDLTFRGPIYRLAGEGAYQPPGGRYYKSPESWYSNFQTENRLAKQSLATVTGTWTSEKAHDKGKYVLGGTPDVSNKAAGIAIVPRSISYPYLSLKMHFKFLRSAQGAFIVFLYEDSDNYWRAGIRRNSGYNYLVIERVSDGNVTEKATSTSVTIATDAWYTLFMDFTPQQVRAYFMNSETELIVSPTKSCTYDLTSETEGLPLPFHVGTAVLDRPDETEADSYGTVTKAFARQIQDSTEDFASSVLGKYAHVGTDWRRIVDYTVVQDDDGDNIALTVDTGWTTVPSVGTSYGVYGTPGDPQILIDDFTFIEGCRVWTIGDIAEDMISLAGVGITEAPEISPLQFMSGASTYRNFATTITDSSAPSIIIHASINSVAGYTGWRLDIVDDFIELYHVRDGVASLRFKHPSMCSLSIADEPEYRVVYCDYNIFVFASDRFVGGFTGLTGTGNGFVGKASVGTYAIQEFGDLQDAFLWGAEESPNSALSRLLSKRRAKLVERQDGTVTLSLFDYRQSLGTWSTQLTRRGEAVMPVPSMIELTGAEARAYFVEPDIARYGLRFRRADNPTAITEEETLHESRLALVQALQNADREVVTLYAPDPAAEVEDRVTVNGTVYIVDSYSVMFASSVDKIKVNMNATLRKRENTFFIRMWDESLWGDFRYA